jgi:hypothetical protein
MPDHSMPDNPSHNGDNPLVILNKAELAALGEGQIAYLRPILSQDVPRLLPNAPAIAPGLQLFLLLSADGTPIVLSHSRDAAIANAWEQDLEMVHVH